MRKSILASLFALLVLPANAGNYTFTVSAHKTSVATIVDTLTNDSGFCAYYRLYNFSGSQKLFWRIDGTNPDVNQDGAYVVAPPGEAIIYAPDANNPPVLKVVTLLAATYSVECH